MISHAYFINLLANPLQTGCCYKIQHMNLKTERRHLNSQCLANCIIAWQQTLVRKEFIVLMCIAQPITTNILNVQYLCNNKNAINRFLWYC